MISVKVTSHLFGRTELSGAYTIRPKTSIIEFAESLQITWDNEALVVVNDQIVESHYLLQEGDHIFFLTPLVGG